ncbi:MAG: hypothetical protein ACOC2Y_06325 [Spirochaetota bacterium]
MTVQPIHDLRGRGGRSIAAARWQAGEIVFLGRNVGAGQLVIDLAPHLTAPTAA